MTPYEVPLTPDPQSLRITLGGTPYRLTVAYRDANEGGWVLDIADANDAPIISGIPLVTGADLLGQYAYLGFRDVLVVQTDHDLNAVPTFDNLGKTSHLYFVTGS